jgi:hypothetical protein
VGRSVLEKAGEPLGVVDVGLLILVGADLVAAREIRDDVEVMVR